MVDPQNPKPDPTTPNPTGGGYAAIAQKLKSRTTDLLALAILAIGFLAIGAKAARWWKQSPEDVGTPQAAAPELAQWGQAETPVTMEFGQLNQALLRQVIIGDAASAGDQLERIAVEQLPEVSLASKSPSLAEQKLLEELGDAPVSRRLLTGESLYRIGDDLPMVIITKSFSGTSQEKSQDSSRVVCWARAFPQDENQWVVILFHPTDRLAATNTGEGTIPLPTGSEQIQSLRDADGRSWIGFRGAGPIQDWQSHFDHAFQERNWERIRPWSNIGSGWVGAFQSPEKMQRAEIWFSVNAEDVCEGMLLREPIPSGGRASK